MTTSMKTGAERPLREGDLIGERYRVGEVIGSGATGVVYRAAALGEERPVALKVIHREHCGDKQIFGRYKREAQILRHLSGNHLVGLLDFIEHEGLLVIALEHVAGDPLEDVLSTPIAVDQCVEISIQVADGLSTAHASGVIHRDLKPANVMIEPEGWPRASGAPPTPRVRILDFGLAKVVHGEHMTTGLTEHDMIFGTPEYMSPEQARGDEVDARCDVYAAGVMLYEMATGKVPFSRRTPLATMTAQLTEPVIPPRTAAPARDIPPALEAVILRALEKEPADRYATAAAFGEALRAVREKRVASIVPPSGETPDPRAAGDIELGETDLAIRFSQVSPERKPGLESRSSRPTPSSNAPPAIVQEPEKGGALWIAVGVVVAILAVAVGVFLAVR